MPPVDIALARCYGEDKIIAGADEAAYAGIDFPLIREKLFART